MKVQYTECLQFAMSESNWFAASLTRQKMAPGAYLATELSAHKHNFNSDCAKDVWNGAGELRYHIGLAFRDSLHAYAWQQPEGQQPLQVF